MWSIGKTFLFIVAIGSSDLSSAGADSAESSNTLFDLRNNKMTLFWTRKMRTYIRRFDFDDDGIILREDFQRMAERFADQEKFNQVEREKAVDNFNELFALLTKAAGSKDEVPMTEELLIKSMKMQRDDPEFAKTFADLLLSCFTPMKVEQQGYFTKNEYRRLYENVGFTQTDFTIPGYTLADTDHDGRVSFVEFYDAIVDYMCSGDESSTAFLGLLI